ncbi:hypothetical protein CsatA_010010 [Cannabis sativa]
MSSFSDIPRSQSVRYAATSPSFEFTDVQRPRGQKKKGALKEIKGALNKIFKGLFKSKKKHLSENAEAEIPGAPVNSEASDHDYQCDHFANESNHPIRDNITEEEESFEFVTPRNSFEFVILRNLESEDDDQNRRNSFWIKMRSSFSDIPRSQSVRYAATSPSFEFTDVQRPRGQKKKGALKEIKGALNKIFKGLFKSKKKHLSENAETEIPRAPVNSEASDHDYQSDHFANEPNHPIRDNITEEEESFEFVTPRNSFEFVIPRNLESEDDDQNRRNSFWIKM